MIVSLFCSALARRLQLTEVRNEWLVHLDAEGIERMSAAVRRRSAQQGPPGYVLRADLNKFLQALVYAEPHGMELSVLSALARLQLDPWEQAAALASLPSEAAARQLESLLSVLPDWLAPGHDGKLTAARLVALLPGSRVSATAEPMAGGLPAPATQAPHYLWIFALVIMLLLSIQWLNASRHLDPPVLAPQITAGSSPQPLQPGSPVN
jgi:hypothetical protein